MAAKGDVRIKAVANKERAFRVKRVPAVMSQSECLRWQGWTYTACIESRIGWCGLPMMVGVFFVEKRSGEEMAPAPGQGPPGAGKVESSLVRMK